ncbi:Mu transposase C-terminal domain-containing protein (plasmid) [Agrobacterium sp. rho-13.3]|uniref:Mu transposase C-terminal domain-containing protein n=1 Tax=Agrobacterium sp. rho-13.3 TaxID=3072980 RepID=UPI002A148493|nr:Mu transposase C-terminal domain-containing protein [Agrobacterium sp. rho-13.3]MDX8312055.1 Mu transposase C-terminal domain-containing protein [Agrobacterium sp. rho-13.3]
MHFWLTFPPEQERALQPTGIHLFGLRYWSAALSADVGRTNSRLLIKYDPRDIYVSRVRAATIGNFVEARYANLTLASVTLHEALAARRTLLAKGRREINTLTIVGTAIEQCKLVDAAMKATATVRRGRTASSKTKVDDSGWGSLRGDRLQQTCGFRRGHGVSWHEHRNLPPDCNRSGTAR